MNLEQLLKDVTVLYEIVGKGNMEEAETMIELIAIDIRAAQSVQADACYCCREMGGCQECCRCWQLLPEESRR